MNIIIKFWHNWLGIEKHDRAWHEAVKVHKLADIAERHGCNNVAFKAIYNRQLLYLSLLK